MADPTEAIAALFAHLSCSRRDFHQRLLGHAAQNEIFGYSTLTAALKGHWPTGPARGFIENALRVYAAELGVNLTQLAREHGMRTRLEHRGPLHTYLKGAWFLVQFRGKRAAMIHSIAEPDFRIAVLVYGGREESGRLFHLIGESTMWHGHVRPHSQDNLLYYSASEISRSGIEESISMIMLGAYGAGQIADHHGIILGVARGEHDAPHFPIYASRALLWRIQNYRKDAVAPLEEKEIANLKMYCGYIPTADVSGNDATAALDPLMLERKEAIARFITRGQSAGNYGDRIFVRG